MKLPNIVFNKGRLVYRRRIPVDLTHLYPRTFFETRLRTQEHGPALVSEHSALQSAFQRMCEDARSGVPEAIGNQGIARYQKAAWASLDDPRTEREKWDDYRKEAEALVRSVRSLSGATEEEDGGDHERREIVADELERIGAPTLLYRAVTQPDATPPKATLADAARVYKAEQLGENPKKSARNTFNKIKRRLEASLGPLDMLALEDLKREHAKKVRDDLLKAPKTGGGTLSIGSVQREINSIKAMISVGIREHDLKGKAFNPFSELSMPASAKIVAKSEWEERDPLPDDILLAVRHRVLTRTRVPELRLIWRLLQATGCRGAEITGLQVDDVVLDHAIPHLWVRWNDERQLKTKTSVRPIPLIGDGLEAAKAALEIARKARRNAPALFPKYATERGPDAVSGALMNHLRNETTNPRCQRRSKIGPRGGAKLGHLGFLRGARGGRRPVSRALHVAGG
ncbi:hypothetical protein [Roseovarius autotrophicus]|uniref:hypothetical protein n=1 Tax=Roseovarius autotrophicus TaxID=2824121 RepID=UPI001B3600FC|nr:hypothetical protein [Roseovarius autotrophicus]